MTENAEFQLQANCRIFGPLQEQWTLLASLTCACALVSSDNDLYVLFRGEDGCKAKLDSVECHDVLNGKIWDLYGTIHVQKACLCLSFTDVVETQ